MGKRREDWGDVFQALGEAVSALLSAEWEALREVVRERWKGALSKAVWAAVFFFAAACFFFVLVALTVTAAVLMVERFTELALWQATLAVALAVFLVILALAGIGHYAFARRIDNPIAAAQERVGDHLAWWRERLLTDEGALPEGDSDG